MNQPPGLPFGDPTAVQQQNRSAVGKGVGLACGGCAALFLLAVMSSIAIGLFVFSTMLNSDAVNGAMARVNASSEVRQHLGTPVEKSWYLTGSIHTSTGGGSADISLPVSGPKGKATVHLMARHDAGGPWVYTRLVVTVSGTEKSIDLLQPPPAEAPDVPPR